MSGTQRAYPRRQVTVPIGVATDERRDCAGITRNISAGGVLFQSVSRFDLGEELSLVFRVDAQQAELHATGRVVRTDLDGPRAALPFVTAVEFHGHVEPL